MIGSALSSHTPFNQDNLIARQILKPEENAQQEDGQAGGYSDGYGPQAGFFIVILFFLQNFGAAFALGDPNGRQQPNHQV